MRCWLSRFSEEPCEPGLFRDPVHLIPKQTLRRRGFEDVWDERVWVPSCRFHHARFDRYALEVPRSALPQSLETFAEEHGFEGYLDRRFGVRSSEPAVERNKP